MDRDCNQQVLLICVYVQSGLLNQWVPSPGVSGRSVKPTVSLSSAEVKNQWSHTSVSLLCLHALNRDFHCLIIVTVMMYELPVTKCSGWFTLSAGRSQCR